VIIKENYRSTAQLTNYCERPSALQGGCWKHRTGTLGHCRTSDLEHTATHCVKLRLSPCFQIQT